MLRVLILLGVTLVTAVLSLSGGFLLLSGSRFAKAFQKVGPYFAVVILLYAAFFDIIPEVLEEEALLVWQVVLLVALGALICMGIGKALGHLHTHGDKHQLKGKSQAVNMLVVDSVHTAADGVVIGMAFAAGLGTGIWTALATVAHEIPQEVGDFSIMVRSKLPKRRILKWQLMSALILVPTALIAYFIGDILSPALPVILSLAAGFLIYIALVEIWEIARSLKAKAPKV